MLPITTFIHKNKYYVYDSNLNKLINVTKEVFLQIRLLKENKLDEYSIYNDVSYESLKCLMEKGFFKESPIEKIEHPWSNIYSAAIDNCMSYIILQTTKRCNFKCRYCHFANDNHKNDEKSYMEWDIARRAIDFLFSHSADSSDVCIGFYGGEPLLNFDIVKQTILYAESKFERHKLSYSMTTNGSLLTKDKMDFISMFPFYLRISFDGPPEIQNRHRVFAKNGQNTFDLVMKNIIYIKETYPDYFAKYVSFNSVLLPEDDIVNVRSFFESNLTTKLSKVTINIANLEGIDYVSYTNNFLDEKNEDSDLHSLRENFDQAFLNKNCINCKTHPNGPCLPGYSRLFVTTNGSFIPCEKISEKNNFANIGNIFEGYNYETIYSLLNIGQVIQDECKNCWCIRFCKICAAKFLSYNKDGYSNNIKEKVCDYYKKKTVSFFKHYIDIWEIV